MNLFRKKKLVTRVIPRYRIVPNDPTELSVCAYAIEEYSIDYDRYFFKTLAGSIEEADKKIEFLCQDPVYSAQEIIVKEKK